MYFKDSVRFKDAKQAIVFATIVAEQVYVKYGYQFVITSWNDGKHMANSFHYKDSAFDCRTRHVSPGHLHKIKDEIANTLPDGFDVILEKDHTHIEADLKNH